MNVSSSKNMYPSLFLTESIDTVLLSSQASPDRLPNQYKLKDGA
jgi:hypothetical protein